MAGQMEYFELSIASIDDVTFIDETRDRRRLLAVCLKRETSGERSDKVRVGHFVTHGSEAVDGFAPPRLQHVKRAKRWVRQQGCFEWVRDHIFELGMITDVVVVAVGCHRSDRPIEKIFGRFHETDDPHAGVDHEVAIATTNVPDIAAHQLDDLRLPEQRDTRVDGPTSKPLFANIKLRQSHTVIVTRRPTLSPQEGLGDNEAKL